MLTVIKRKTGVTIVVSEKLHFKIKTVAGWGAKMVEQHGNFFVSLIPEIQPYQH